MQATIGSHDVRLSGDVVVGKLRDSFTVEHARDYFAFLQGVQDKIGPFFILTDISELKGMDASARRWMTDQSQEFKCRGAAMYGASLTSRTVITLLLRALALFRPSIVPMTFTKNEQEAQAWLDSLRP
jgi:hypothetical protein